MVSDPSALRPPQHGMRSQRRQNDSHRKQDSRAQQTPGQSTGNHDDPRSGREIQTPDCGGRRSCEVGNSRPPSGGGEKRARSTRAALTWCRAVRPSTLAVSTSAPRARSRLTSSVSPLEQAARNTAPSSKRTRGPARRLCGCRPAPGRSVGSCSVSEPRQRRSCSARRARADSARFPPKCSSSAITPLLRAAPPPPPSASAGRGGRRPTRSHLYCSAAAPPAPPARPAASARSCSGAPEHHGTCSRRAARPPRPGAPAPDGNYKSLDGPRERRGPGAPYLAADLRGHLRPKRELSLAGVSLCGRVKSRGSFSLRLPANFGSLINTSIFWSGKGVSCYPYFLLQKTGREVPKTFKTVSWF